MDSKPKPYPLDSKGKTPRRYRNYASFKVYDLKSKKYFEPTYRAFEGNLEEMLLSQTGRLVRVTLDEKGETVMQDESLFEGRYVVEIEGTSNLIDDLSRAKLGNAILLMLNALLIAVNVGLIIKLLDVYITTQ